MERDGDYEAPVMGESGGEIKCLISEIARIALNSVPHGGVKKQQVKTDTLQKSAKWKTVRNATNTRIDITMPKLEKVEV